MVRCRSCPLRQLHAFKPLSADQIDHIQSMKADELALGPEHEIIAPGQKNMELYTVLSGWAYRFKELPDGRRQILNFALPGDLVGLQASMFDASPYGAMSLTDVVLCVMPRRKIFGLFGQMPELAFDVTWLGAREESQIDENLTSAGSRTAIERIAALIVALYRRCEAIGLVVDHAFDFPLTQQTIADAMGLSLVHTNKTIARLRRMGMFSMHGGRLKLENPRVLGRVAQFFDSEFNPRPLI